MESQTDVQPTPDALYNRLESWPWDTDPEFQSGLRMILQNNPPQEQRAEIELRARCFYAARKFGVNIDFEHYKQWRAQRSANQANPTPLPPSAAPEEPAPAPTSTLPTSASTSLGSEGSQDPSSLASILAQASQNAPSTPNTTATSEADGPKFSYAELVELIQSGKEIPGIKQIPNTVLEGQGTESTQTKRRKPWERDINQESTQAST